MRTRLPASFVASLGLSSLLAFALGAAGGCGRLKPAAGSDGAAGDTGGSTGTAGSGGGGKAGGGGTVGAAGNAGTSGGHVLVTVSGTAAPHPLNALVGAPTPDAGTADAATDAATDAAVDGTTDAASDAADAASVTTDDFSMLKIAIVDPTATIVDPNAPPLAATTLDTSATNCTAAGCAFSLTGVDITNQTLGLVGTLEDKRTGAARLWVKTGTGMGTAAFVASAKAAKTAITDRRAFIVSRKLEAKLALFVNATLGTTFAAGDLEARGFLIGHILDKLSTATTPAGPAGVAGATVTAHGAFDVIYPNATFTGKGTATSSNGIFLMVPQLVDGGAQAVVTSWAVVPPTGDTRTWETHLAGSSPGNAFIIIMPANE